MTHIKARIYTRAYNMHTHAHTLDQSITRFPYGNPLANFQIEIRLMWLESTLYTPRSSIDMDMHYALNWERKRVSVHEYLP